MKFIFTTINPWAFVVSKMIRKNLAKKLTYTPYRLYKQGLFLFKFVRLICSRLFPEYGYNMDKLVNFLLFLKQDGSRKYRSDCRFFYAVVGLRVPETFFFFYGFPGTWTIFFVLCMHQAGRWIPGFSCTCYVAECFFNNLVYLSACLLWSTRSMNTWVFLFICLLLYQDSKSYIRAKRLCYVIVWQVVIYNMQQPAPEDLE